MKYVYNCLSFVANEPQDVVAKYIEDLHQTIGQLNEEADEYANKLTAKDKEIKDLKEMNDWYKMWHDKFKKQIEDLTTELETYRPTRLKGEGQTKCSKCGDLSWTDFGYSKYKGQILCDKCLKEIYHYNDTN